MQEFINSTLQGIYIIFSNEIPQEYKPLVILAFYTLIIAIYSIFIWKFYKFLARKNILRLNLSQYNTSEHPLWNKLLASLFFLLEYIIILPIIVFFWFSVLAIFLLILSKDQSVNQILLISAAIIAATRITAYYATDLSKDLAKMFPFTVLAVFLLEPNFFSVQKFIQRFSQIPNMLSHILIYLVFIFGLEVFFRIIFVLFDLMTGSEENEESV